MKKIMVFTIIALAFFACDDGNDNKGNKDNKDLPQPHETTITAFGKTIAVTGDAAISTADFNTAVGKLGEAMVALSGVITTEHPLRSKYDVMLNRTGFTIIIETGNASPNADANKSMTIGVNYLLENDTTPTIAAGIAQKVGLDDAFAE
jgi:hypothetical protein